jgi:hypothetical protein
MLRPLRESVEEVALAKVRVNISISDPKKFTNALAHARKAGLDVEHAFEDLGTVSGTIESAFVDKLRKVDGISSVEPDRDLYIRSSHHSF